MLTEHGPAYSEIHKYHYFSKHAPLTLTARSDALMAMGGLVRLLTHDFTHETIYRSHAAFDFAARQRAWRDGHPRRLNRPKHRHENIRVPLWWPDQKQAARWAV